MDDNTRQVAVAIVGVASTLAGIGLGWLLQSRRRHDEVKRSTYARFYALTRRTIASIDIAHRAGVASESPEAVALDLWESVALIEIVGGKEVRSAAGLVQYAVTQWIHEHAEQPVGRAVVITALQEFVEAARKELG